jgi:hypothetical protein
MKIHRTFILLATVQLLIVISEGWLIWDLLKETPSEFATSSAVASAALFKPVPINMQSLTEQPLFQPTRKPYMPPTNPELIEVAPLPAPINPPILTGIILDSSKPLVLLENNEQKTTSFIGVGDQFDGWTIKLIEKKSVVLTKPSHDDIELSLPSLQLSVPAILH